MSEPEIEAAQTSTPDMRATRAGLTKVLPTDRVSFEKQWQVVRAYAAAGGPAREAVTNEKVASVMSGLAASSISICNPFLSSVGLIVADGRKFRPSEALLEYQHAYDWDPAGAGQKLNRVLRETWAAKSLLPKLAYRTLNKDEAIKFLAEDSKATVHHRRSLETFLEFLAAAGVIRIEGDSIQRGELPRDDAPDASLQEPAKVHEPVHAMGTRLDVERFTIPIPGKEAAEIAVPKNLDADDWDMLSAMIATYIKRLRKQALGGQEGDP
jgi:hypothetical protein